jgi:HD superfamily phosphohydrolase YqeK
MKYEKQKRRDEMAREKKRIEMARHKMENEAKIEEGRMEHRIRAQQLAEEKNRKYARDAQEQMQAAKG